MFKRIVVKVGTSTVTHKTGKINLRRLDRLARVLTDIKNRGCDVILVTSGAIGSGVGKMGLDRKPDDIPSRQALAAIGQCELMSIYDRLFSDYGTVTAQILLQNAIALSENGDNRGHAQNTFNRLFEYGAIPIVNENDSVSVDELVNCENDTLSAIVAELTEAEVLVLLTDTDGLYNADPSVCPDAELIHDVYDINGDIRGAAGKSATKSGTGGMATKIEAAEIAVNAGIDVIIASGENPDILYDIFDGAKVGTKFYKKEKDGGER